MAKQPQDIRNRQIGFLVALSPTGRKDNHGAMIWKCRCVCGKPVIRSYSLLTNPTRLNQSCGCSRRTPGVPPADITGQTFGYLTALRSLPERTSKGRIWECRCRCGVLVKRVLAELRRQTEGRARLHSCGCSKRGPKNERYRGVGDLSSNKWRSIRRGAKDRGIAFALSAQDAWDLFVRQEKRCALTGVEIRLDPMSMRAGTSTASLDRIDSTKGYVQGNVQWVHVVINVMKHVHSTEAFVTWCRAVVSHIDSSTFGKGTKAQPHMY